ncbi:MAG: hypothetical protein Q8W51_05320 [Candidatus Palauibacterales bacterium]|nr:hypothetical protein [Candidatus Palauibacterales bacterium]MDP2529136.1 hypothetical protein [Candidatus Palauibacterales bacterium]MDP2583917.1 hypothetical protein [Candidatus Palauibacterales bacterium]
MLTDTRSFPKLLVRSLAGLAWAVGAACSSPSTPLDELSQSLTTEHFVFHYSEGDHVDAAWQEAYHAWLLDRLGVQLSGRIDYYKYRDRAQKLKLMGVDGNAIAMPELMQVHTIFPRDNHETVHVLVNLLWGRAPALFGEGIAVAFQSDPVAGDTVPRWNTRPLDDIARDAWTAGTVPALDDLILNDSFRTYAEGLTYPLAGSFVHYLLEWRGVAPLRSFFEAFGAGDAGGVRDHFRAAYGEELDMVWDDWRAQLVSGL